MEPKDTKALSTEFHEEQFRITVLHDEIITSDPVNYHIITKYSESYFVINRHGKTLLTVFLINRTLVKSLYQTHHCLRPSHIFGIATFKIKGFFVAASAICFVFMPIIFSPQKAIAMPKPSTNQTSTITLNRNDNEQSNIYTMRVRPLVATGVEPARVINRDENRNPLNLERTRLEGMARNFGRIGMVAYGDEGPAFMIPTGIRSARLLQRVEIRPVQNLENHYPQGVMQLPMQEIGAPLMLENQAENRLNPGLLPEIEIPLNQIILNPAVFDIQDNVDINIVGIPLNYHNANAILEYIGDENNQAERFNMFFGAMNAVQRGEVLQRLVENLHHRGFARINNQIQAEGQQINNRPPSRLRRFFNLLRENRGTLVQLGVVWHTWRQNAVLQESRQIIEEQRQIIMTLQRVMRISAANSDNPNIRNNGNP